MSSIIIEYSSNVNFPNERKFILLAKFLRLYVTNAVATYATGAIYAT